jgi:hypothetical protein
MTAGAIPGLYDALMTVYNHHVSNKPKMGDLDRLEQDLDEVIKRTFALAQSHANIAEIFEQENTLRDQRSRLLADVDRLLLIRRNLRGVAQREADLARAAISLSTLMANVDKVYHPDLERQFTELEEELSEVLRQS